MADQISTPMQDGFHKEPITREAAGAVVDHNPCPYFSKPHDKGPDTIPVKFFETVKGRGADGPPGKDAAVTSTMGSGVAKKS